MAMPPSCAAEKPASAPESLPMGVRAPARITEPAIKGPPQGVERVRRFYGAPVAPPIGVVLLGSRSLAPKLAALASATRSARRAPRTLALPLGAGAGPVRLLCAERQSA